MENVLVPLPAALPGAWTIEVAGASVNPEGEPASPEIDQPFARVALPML